MKFSFLQSDFSAGEIGARAQGHVTSEAYKAGLRLAANVAPTRTGSVASRAGLKALLDGKDAATGLASNMPVQHIPIHDGPYGDFTLEVSPTGLRILDKSGVLPWDFPPTSEFVQFTTQDGSFAYADPKTRTVYLRSDLATGLRSYYLTKGTGAQNALLPSLGYLGTPLLTNNQWTLSGRIAGDSITAHIVQSNPAHFQDIAIAPATDGTFSITFNPNIGGADEAFYIQLKTAAATTATTLWDINLVKNNTKTIHNTTAASLNLPAGATTPLAPATFGGVNVAPTQERVRAAGFWGQGDFWVALAGGPNNCYAGFALRWHPDPAVTLLTKWTFGTLPCTANSLAQIVGANAVAVFQDRLWYGINLANGKRVVRASVVGYGKAWGYLAQANSTGAATLNGKDWLFQFIVETETFIVGAGPNGFFTYSFPSNNPKAELLITVSNVKRFEGDFLVAGHEKEFESRPDTGTLVDDQTVLPGGDILFRVPPQVAPFGLNPGDVIKVTRVALADDPLDLTLASPAGKIAWLNVLRGLALGTTRNEKLFQRGVALAIDPATGQSFDLEDESSYGADPALPALDINEKLLFVQQGRKVLRYAGISITTSGGLVSEDVGVAGEHLTAPRVRSLCFLKSPVPRVVFALDDGTGAVMTIGARSVAFSRLTIPACYGGIYNVAALNTDQDSELWVATENGVTLWAATFESDIISKEVLLPAASPLPPTHLKYDTENPLPPVMDGWQRLPLVNQGGTQYVSGLSSAAVGQNAYVLLNGQVQGPYAVVAFGAGQMNGRVNLPASLALDVFWTDAAGKRRAQEDYAGIAFPTHQWTSLPLEGGNPVGTSQASASRKAQLYLRFVDSFLPLVNGTRPEERASDVDIMDIIAGRVTGDRRATELGFQRAAVVDVVMDVPLRMEVSAIFGGVVVNNI